MKKLFYVLGSILPYCSMAQGLVNNGAQIVVNGGAYVHIVNTSSKGNFENQNTGLVHNNGTIMLEGDWLNNSSNKVFTSNNGKVELSGPGQQIGGTAVTAFYDLTLSGTGTKTLMVDAIAGGTYATGRNGVLDLRDRPLDLNSHIMTQSNTATNAIQRTSGYIISETNATTGYGRVLWITGASPSGKTYLYPFGRLDGTYIPYTLTFQSNGNASGNIDSSGVAMATYPTATNAGPNNRPFPTGVAVLNNEYSTEHAPGTIDRYWVAQRVGYTSVPTAQIAMAYADDEWDNSNSSTNNIIENELGFIRYNGSAWTFPPSGTDNAAGNSLLTGTQDVFGVFTLANPTECPVANFSRRNNCEEDNILFADSSSYRKGYITNHWWAFGDGAQAIDSSTQHPYANPGSYTVSHIVLLSTGCLDTITRAINIDPKPVAAYVFDQNHCLGQTMAFTDRSTSTPGTVTAWRWDMGNAQTSTAQNPTMLYLNAGNYPVSLIATNNFNCSDTAMDTVTIFNNPVADFDVEDICLKAALQITNNSSGPAPMRSYQWQLGDGNTSTAFEPAHRYAAAGTYNIVLVVTDTNNCTGTSNENVNVIPQAIARFTYNPQQISFDSAWVYFINQSQNANTYAWDFGDGFVSGSDDPDHEYSDTGRYNVTLIADNALGCADTAVQNIYVEPVFRMYIPNSFTPGDGALNETFGPEGTLMGLHDYEMLVLNRWGEIIFTSDDINKRWDGTYKGEPVQIDAYVWIITARDYKKTRYNYKGTVTLLR